ncbi:hypothetical protein MTO96_005924 [Rhipicephalus appendiculatus]
MAYERRLQCLKLIVLTPLFFNHVTEAGLAKGLKCPTLKASMHAEWNWLGGQDWLEGLQHPDKTDICYVLRYFPANNTFAIQTKQGPAGPVKVLAYYKFRKQDDRQYLIAHDVKFYQILDTDYANWVLLHHCQEGGSGSRYVVALSTPMAEVPAKVMKRVQDAMAKSGEERKVTWRRSPCMLKKPTEKPSDTLSMARRKPIG